MSVSPEVEALVRQVMATGDFASEDEVLLTAVKSLAEGRPATLGRRRHKELRASSLGKRLREIRQEYISQGGALLTAAELDLELAERRGSRYSKSAASRLRQFARQANLWRNRLRYRGRYSPNSRTAGDCP
jgi:hypothetical protein